MQGGSAGMPDIAGAPNHISAPRAFPGLSYTQADKATTGVRLRVRASARHAICAR